MEHIETVCSLESKVFLISICFIRILNILEVIAKLLNPTTVRMNCALFPLTRTISTREWFIIKSEFRPLQLIRFISLSTLEPCPMIQAMVEQKLP